MEYKNSGKYKPEPQEPKNNWTAEDIFSADILEEHESSIRKVAASGNISLTKKLCSVLTEIAQHNLRVAQHGRNRNYHFIERARNNLLKIPSQTDRQRVHEKIEQSRLETDNLFQSYLVYLQNYLTDFVKEQKSEARKRSDDDSHLADNH